jgi:type IV pilus assembly protein PilF
MTKVMPRFAFISFISVVFSLSGCVTQSYENESTTPIVENDSTNNEVAMIRISLGLGYLNMGNTTQAKLNLEKAKRFSPKLVQVYTAFAHYYDVVGEPKQATDAYEKALSLNSDDPDTLNNYGVFLCRQEKYQAAEKFTLQAIAIPTYLMVSQSYENLALCQLKAKKFTKAEKYFTKSIQHSPNRASALLQMVRLQYAFADYKTAQQYFRRYEKATRRFSAEALALAYKVYEKQRNRRVAKNYATMLVKMFPNSYQAKQYILNELAYIEADDLAKDYQQSILSAVKAKPKKRVVVLSPNKSRKSFKKVPLPTKKNKKSSIEKLVTEKAQLKNKLIKSTAKVKKSSNADVYTVEVGDSLFSISLAYNTNMKALELWNNISRNDVLKLGRKLYVSDPTSVDTTSDSYLPISNTIKNTEQEKTQ